MKRIISLALVLASVLTFGVYTAPAGVADALPAISENAEIVYDAASGYIKGFGPGVTAADVMDSFDGDVTVADPEGTVIDASGSVGTDYTVRSGDATAKLLVPGDVNSDAAINARDIVCVMLALLNGSDGYNTLAADVDFDGSVSARDITAVMKWLVGYDVVLGERYYTVRTEKQEAPAEDATMDLFFVDSLAKNAPDSNVFTEDRTFVMNLARNEKESCQAEIYSFEKQEDLNVSLTPFDNGHGGILESQLLFVDYIRVQKNGEDTGIVIPDRLPPVQKAFSIAANRRQGLYIEVAADENTAAGLYRARLDVTNSLGQVVKTAYVYANVWDFALPVETMTKTMLGMSYYQVSTKHPKGDTSTNAELYARYYEYMLDNRLNVWCMPANPLDDAADRWMSDPRVNTFLVAGGYAGDLYNNQEVGSLVDEEAVAAIYSKLSKNPDWLRKAAFYCTDEPGVYWLEDKFPQMMTVYSQLQRVFPGARIVVPDHVMFLQDKPGAHPEYGDYGHVDNFDIVAQYSTVMCPSSRLYANKEYRETNKVDWYHEDAEEQYGTIEERMKVWREEGKETWWYTANSPYAPMSNISQSCTGMQNRMLFWQQYHYDIDGFLYWTVSEWGPRKRNYIEAESGLLLYAGDDFGIAGPVACQRAGIVRDGLEDVEYLHLAESLLGKEEADKFVARLVTNANDFSSDSAELYKVRYELGSAIEAALRK